MKPRSWTAWVTLTALALIGVVVAADDAPARLGAGMLTCEVGKGYAHCLFHKSNGQTETSRTPAPTLASPVQAASGDRTEVVRFAAGASSATVEGSVSGYDSVNYVLGASSGQFMSVLFSPDNTSCYFNLLPPSGDTALFNGSTSGNEFADTLPASGNYTVQAYLMRNAARRNETCRYSITFEITGGPGASAPSAPGARQRVSTDTAAQACVGHASNEFGAPVNAFRVLSTQGSTEGTGVEIVAEDGRQGRCFVGPHGAVINFEASGGATTRVDQSATAAPAGGQPAAQSDVGAAARQSCLSAVSSETNEGDVTVLSSEFSEANSLVMVGVGAQRAPWRCLVANDGAVEEVSFAGDEGRL